MNLLNLGKIRIRNKYLLFTFVGLTLSIFSAKFAHAQLVQQTITITPPSIKADVNPGDKKEGTLGLINDSNGDLTFVVGVYDFVVTDTSGTPELLPYGTIKNKYSAANWVAAAPDGFTVKAHTRFNLNYYIQVPKDAGPGGHYAAIVYQPLGSAVKPGSGAKINTQIATLVYLNVNGTINEYAKVTKFSAPSFQEYGPVQITSEIKNFGDIHITPQGSITLKDMLGRTISSSSLLQRNIFPGNISLIYNNMIGSKIMFGKFTAVINASYGRNNNLPLNATVTFWVFPWKVTLIIILLILVVILSYLLKRKASRKNKNTGSQPTNSPTSETPVNEEK